MNIVAEVEQQLKNEIEAAILKAELASKEEMPEIILETPKEKEHGDYATNMAMQLARIAKKAPKQIAEEIVEQIDTGQASVKKIDIAGPGFINFFMDQSFLTKVVTEINEAKSQYGKSDHGAGKKFKSNLYLPIRPEHSTWVMPVVRLTEMRSQTSWRKQATKLIASIISTMREIKSIC